MGNDALKAVDEMDGLRQSILAEIEEHGLTQAVVAREADVSTSQVGGFLKGNYTGDMAAAGERLAKWLQARKARTRLESVLPSGNGWVATPSAKRVLATLTYAHHAGALGLVYGGAGVGKTETARHYAAINRNVWHVTMSPACRQLGGCLGRIARAVGIKRPATWYPEALENQIIEAVEATYGLIIVDEAQHLDLEAIETLRTIRDAAGVGLVLMGNEVVYARITGGSRKAHFAQLFSRIAKKTALSAPTQADVEALALASGVTGEKELRYLIAIGKGHEALRGVGNCLKLAATGVQPGTPLTLAHLKTAWKELAEDA